MRRISAAIALCALNGHVSGQGVDTYDGIWSGEWRCGAYAAGVTGRWQDGFKTPVSFVVKGGVGDTRLEDATARNDLILRISGNQATVDHYGKLIAGNSSWKSKLVGSVTGGRIATTGAMVGANGSAIRDSCSISLTNPDVQGRLDAATRAQSTQATAAATAGVTQGVPAPSTGVPVQPNVEPQAGRREQVAATPAASATATVKTARVVTAPPVAVAATKDGPARNAAIASLEPKAASEKAYAKVTSNPIDQVKKTGPNDVWINFNPSITVQERQFCRIVENHRANLSAAEQTNNQIKVNEALKSFVQAINALLPDGRFQNWVMRSVRIAQASDGSAAVLFELPCGVYVGSNTCDANAKNFYGNIAEGSRVYSELAKMTVRDFSLVSGQFVFPDDKVFDKARSVAAYGYLKTAAHCESKSMPLNSEFFGVGITALSVIK